MRAIAAAIALALLWLALPVQLHRSGDGGSGDDCLKLADQPPTDFAAQLPLLERCSAVVPDDAELLADLGAAYEHAGRGEDAERAYQKALVIDPDFADAHRRLAARLAARGQAEAARAHLDAARKLQPNRAEPQP